MIFKYDSIFRAIGNDSYSVHFIIKVVLYPEDNRGRKIISLSFRSDDCVLYFQQFFDTSDWSNNTLNSRNYGNETSIAESNQKSDGYIMILGRQFSNVRL